MKLFQRTAYNLLVDSTRPLAFFGGVVPTLLMGLQLILPGNTWTSGSSLGLAFFSYIAPDWAFGIALTTLALVYWVVSQSFTARYGRKALPFLLTLWWGFAFGVFLSANIHGLGAPIYATLTVVSIYLTIRSDDY